MPLPASVPFVPDEATLLPSAGQTPGEVRRDLTFTYLTATAQIDG
jgi:hypothetical protein